MTQAFLNVLQNALHATPAGGSIVLSCEPVSDDMKYTIAISGEGIPSELLGKDFQSLQHELKASHGSLA